MLKRHLRQQHTVEEYGRNIKQLASRAQSLLSAGHPEGCVCTKSDLAGAPPTGIPAGPSGKIATVLGKIATVFMETVGLRKLLIGPIPFHVSVLCE